MEQLHCPALQEAVPGMGPTEGSQASKWCTASSDDLLSPPLFLSFCSWASLYMYTILQFFYPVVLCLLLINNGVH